MDKEDTRQAMKNGGTTDPGIGRFLLPLALGAMLNPLNSTMLSTALTQLTHSFGRDVSSGALLITPLYITATIGQPLMGRLADIYSPRKVNIAGLILVMAAALLGGLAPSFGWLIVSRVLLGLGTSANYPSAIAILRRRYTAKGTVMPPNVLAWIIVAGQVSIVLGPVIGGALTQWVGWKGIFLVNVPLVLATLWLLRAIPPQPAAGGTKRYLDITGILIFSGLLVSFFFTITSRPFNLLWPAALVVFLAGLIGWERRLDDPFIHVRLFRQQPFLSLVYIQSTASSYILYLVLYGLPQWLEGVQKLSPANTGLLMLPMSLAAAAASLLISRLGKPRSLNLMAVISQVAACIALFALHAGTPLILIIGVTLLQGLATGLNPTANQASLNEEAPQHLTGISFGLYRTFVYVGAIASGAQLKSIFHKGVTDDSFRAITWFAMCSSLIMIVLYLPMVVRRRRRKATAALSVQTAE
jgi:MFS family permease